MPNTFIHQWGLNEGRHPITGVAVWIDPNAAAQPIVQPPHQCDEPEDCPTCMGWDA